MRYLGSIAARAAAIFGVVLAAQAGIQDGLVLYYDFQNAADTAIDLSGNENHGQILGGDRREGWFGHGMRFNGKDDEENYILVPYAPSLDVRGISQEGRWLARIAA